MTYIWFKVSKGHFTRLYLRDWDDFEYLVELAINSSNDTYSIK